MSRFRDFFAQLRPVAASPIIDSNTIQPYDGLDLAAQYIKKASLVIFHSNILLPRTVDAAGRAIYGDYYGQYPCHNVLEKMNDADKNEILFDLLNAWEIFETSAQTQAQARIRTLLVELFGEERTAVAIEGKRAEMADTERQAKRKDDMAERIKQQQDADMLDELHRERLVGQAERMVQSYVDVTDRHDEIVDELNEQLEQARSQADVEALADEVENPAEFSEGEGGDSVFSDVESVDDTASDYST